VNFELSEESKMLQESLRRFLSSHYSSEFITNVVNTGQGYSQEVWHGLAELGVIAALFSEQHDGYGGDGFDLTLVFEELGRVGALEPLLETAVLGGGLIAELGEPGSRYEISRVQTTANWDGKQYILQGHKAVVINAEAADYIIVSARTSGQAADLDGVSLFLVPSTLFEKELRSYPLSSGAFASELFINHLFVPGDALLGQAGDAVLAIEHAYARSSTAICAVAVGLMDRIQSLTVEYLKSRQQFGQPIGKFQVLQHRMADMLIEIEQAKSALINLAGHLDSPRHERETHVSAAKNLTGIVAKLVAEESIQMHGGIAVTMEYELAHLIRQLVMVDQRFGDSTYHLERFIELVVA